jgi:glutaredoxin
MNVTIFSQPGCLACNLVKSVLTEHKQEFVERIIGFDISVSEFKMRFPDAETVPLIIMGEEHIKYSDFLRKFMAANEDVRILAK